MLWKSLAVAWVGLGAAGAAQGELQFTLTYDAARSAPPDFDPRGRGLTAILTEAAQRWAALFPTAQERIEVTYYWSSELGTLLAHTGERADGAFLIRLNPYQQWFLDMSPEDDLEFLFGPLCVTDPGSVPSWMSVAPPGAVTAEDLPSPHRPGGEAPWLTGNPGNLELAYVGRPLLEQALGRYDLLTTAIHELGHTLLWPAQEQVQREGAFPAGSFGLVADPDEEHVLLAQGLMAARYEGSGRSLPSAADAFMISAVRGWAPRLSRVRLSAAAEQVRWSHAAWPYGVPGPGDGVLIQDPALQRLTLDTDVAVKDLTLAQGADRARPVTLDLNGQRLDVAEHLLLNGNLGFPQYTRMRLEAGEAETHRLSLCGSEVYVGAGSRLVVLNSARVDQNAEMILEDSGAFHCPSGELTLGFGAVTLDHGTLTAARVTVSRMGKITGQGVLRGLDRLSHAGTLRAQGDRLVISGAEGAVLDLDGPGDSRHAHLDARSGDLHIEGELSDPFSGRLDVGPGRLITFTHPCLLDATARALLSGGAAWVAPRVEILNRGALQAEGEGNVIRGDVFWHNARVELRPGAELAIEGPLRLRGGSYSGKGTLRCVGPVTVSGQTLVDVEHWILGPGAALSLAPGARFSLAGSFTQRNVEGGAKGVITLPRGSVLEVGRDWTLHGDLRVEGGTVRGAALTVLGRVRGWGVIEADLRNEGRMESAGGTLRVTGRYSGSGSRRGIDSIP